MPALVVMHAHTHTLALAVVHATEYMRIHTHASTSCNACHCKRGTVTL